MMASHMFMLIYILLFALFSIWAWKLWHGEWLNSIADNTFSSEEELELPYLKRMAKEVAILLVVCDLMFAVLIICELSSAGEQTAILAAFPFGVALVIGSIVVVVRANKAAAGEQVETGMREQGWPTKEANSEFGGGRSRS